MNEVVETTKGIDHIFNYDNIAIVVMFVIILLQWGVIAKLLGGIFKMKDALANISNLISILNERLNKHD